MADMKIRLQALKKEVLVTVPDGGNLKESFNEASHFVRTLEANEQIRDREAGVNPPGATHEVVRQRDGQYRLRRFRFA